MLCCVHLTVNLWVSSKYYGFLYLSRCLIFKVLRTFWKVFCRFLPNLYQQCVNYYITFIFVCQHFLKVFKKCFKISFITFQKLFSVLSNFSVVCAFLKRLRYYITPFYKLQPLFSIFLNFLFFLKKQFKSRIFVAFSY